jgi:FkbM family methyltransferase
MFQPKAARNRKVRLGQLVLVLVALVAVFVIAAVVGPVATQRAYLKLAGVWFHAWPVEHGKAILFRGNDFLYRVGLFKPVIIDVQGGPMELDGRDMVTQSILTDGIWEPKVTAFVRDSVKPGDVVVDIGAHVGYYTLLTSRLVGDAGRVVAVEPNPPTIARLERNLALNRSRNVVVQKVACTDAETTLKFYQAPLENTGESSMSKDSARQGTEIIVPGVPLDKIIQSLGLTHVNFVKIDVEGAEVMVLNGMKSVLATHHPILEIELVDERLKSMGASLAAAKSLIQSYGYTLKGTDEEDDYFWVPSAAAARTN